MKTVALTVLLLTLPLTALGQGNGSSSGPGKYFDFRKKAVNKEGSRWTLQEWLSQKDRNRMMDLWLAMYAPSPYEFYLSGSHNSYQTETVGSTTPTPSETSYSGKLGAYAYIVGLGLEHENNWKSARNDLTGTINLRIAGNAVQGTHLILNYGNRDRNFTNNGVPARYNQQFYGADLNLYLMKYFGLQAMHRQFVTLEDPTVGKLEEKRSEAGAFIDFWSLRVYGNWYQETLNTTTTTGVQSGFYFFF